MTLPASAIPTETPAAFLGVANSATGRLWRDRLDARGAARGLLLYASYPASNMSESLQIPVMSISGDRDGLSTPDKIAASRSTLPTGTEFVVIDGAVHAQFGDYGVQPGDGSPTITDGRAREQIDAASLRFLKRIDDSEERER